MKKLTSLALALALLLAAISGCSSGAHLNPNDPVTLSIWHVYGNQTESPFNDMIDSFNSTVGKEKGVYVAVSSILDSDSIDASLFASASNAPGAGDFPDLFTAYPRVAEGIGMEKLTDWNEIYSADELSVYVDDFLREGNIDGKQLTIPTAKSTELLFVNKTIFDRFCKDTGHTLSGFESFDELFDMSTDYFNWSGGKDLFQYDDLYNFFLINVAAKGGELISNGKPDCTSEQFEDIFSSLAVPAISGGVSLYKNYATDLWKTGDVISYVASSAGILYARDDVTYPDNRTEQIEMSTLPYPVFDGAAPTVLQRGVTLFAHNTGDKRKNSAIKIFVDYLSEKENNISFAVSAGYIPGTEEAFNGLFSSLDRVENPKYRMLYDAVSRMYGEYNFMPLPVFENSSAVQKDFDAFIVDVFADARNEYASRIASGEDKDAVLSELCDRCLETVRNEYK